MASNTSNLVAKLFLYLALAGSFILLVLIGLSYYALHDIDQATALLSFAKYEHPILPINASVYALTLLLAIWLYARGGSPMYFIYGLFIFIFFTNLDYFWLVGKYFERRYPVDKISDVVPIDQIVAVGLNVLSISITLFVYFAVRAKHLLKKKGSNPTETSNTN